MKIIFAGTASGKTSRIRNHSSLFIQSAGHDLLIDCGDGISKTLLNLNLNCNLINSILITHLHADHFSGIASLITQMKIGNRTAALRIYAHKNLIEPITKFLEISCLFIEKMKFDLRFIPFEFETDIKLSDTIVLSAKQNSHITQTDILKIYPSEIFISASLLLTLGSKKIFYTSDIGSADDLFLFEQEKPDWLIAESTHIDLNDIMHAHRRLNTERLYITHYGDDLAAELSRWRANFPREERDSITICADGLEINI